MKKIIILLVVSFLTISVVLTGCSSNSLGSKQEIAQSGNQVNTSQSGNVNVDTTTHPTNKNLNNTEIEGIIYMVEEEKLARDVYQYLYNLWGLNTFSNISQAEQTHMNEVLSLIEKYNLENPLQDKSGVFTNEHLQTLYNDLTTQASKSLTDALKVSALIEETDIIDLKTYLNFTTNSDIKTVYSNLMNGSENHLRAFVSQLKNQGVTYSPVLLTEEEYNAIISSSTSKGKGSH